MGKADLFNKMGYIKGTFHARMGTVKDKNHKDLTEAEEIKIGWQEYTEELYKNGLSDLDNHEGIVTHLKPDILECEVNWALGSITTNKASGGNGIPVELFKILKDDAVKVYSSMSTNLENTTLATRLESSVFLLISKKDNAKEFSNYLTIAFISHASKVMLQILQARLQQYIIRELPDVLPDVQV